MRICRETCARQSGIRRLLRKNTSVAGSLVCLTAVLISSAPVTGTTIISVTAPPALSFGGGAFSTSWSESQTYHNVTITALVNSFLVGQTPTAVAYLTTRIGPGTTTMDEIAHATFTVPLNLPVCSPASCGANLTLFSGLSLGPGTYFVTMATDPASTGTVGWFPAANPTVITDTGVTKGSAFFTTSAPASYAPASNFGVFQFTTNGVVQSAMNFTVVAVPVVAVPEPAAWLLIGFGALFLFLRPQKRMVLRC